MATNFVLAGNGPHLNRGCEAIVRGTVEILRHAFGECKFTNAHFSPMTPPEPNCETDSSVETVVLPWVPDSGASLRWRVLDFAYRRLPWRIRTRLVRWYCRELGKVLFAPLEQRVLGSKGVLAIGGDNYSLDYGTPIRHLALDSFVVRQGTPLVLWGASLGSFAQHPRGCRMLVNHFRRNLKAIFLREERSLRQLQDSGLGDRCFLMPDPAFIMKPEHVPSARLGFHLDPDAVGINLSPLMANYCCNGDPASWKYTATSILRAIRTAFPDNSIILIPHVTIPTGQQDHGFMKGLLENMTDSVEGIHLLPPDLSSAETKYVIAGLRCFVGARTHATIASLSTGVPTLSLAYSQKAFAINETIFRHTRYVVPPGQMTAERVVATLNTVMVEKSEIRALLSSQAQDRRTLALRAGEVLREVIT